MRVLLFTGKGGVGKTTVAAATAAHAARRGSKTLVLSTDRAHSLADAFGVALGPAPVEVDTGLYAVRVDTQRRFERAWSRVSRYLADLLAAGGTPVARAEELTVLPGAEDVLALMEVRDQVAGGLWDALVVDCAPTAETLRLLALPEALAWYVERTFPAHRRLVRSARPLLDLLGVPSPPDGVLDAATRLHAELAEVRAMLRSREVSVRLVLTPESVVVAETRRAFTSLALFGYPVDSVVANRVFPHAEDGWLAVWGRAQERHLAEVRDSFAGLPVRQVPYCAGEPVGLRALRDLGSHLYGEDDPLGAVPACEPMRVERVGEEFDLTLALPLAERGDVTLTRSGDELAVTVGGRRRLVALPSVLRRCVAQGATLRDGRLRVRFRPDPAQWPSRLRDTPPATGDGLDGRR